MSVSTFGHPRNVYRKTLAAPHAIGDGQLVLESGAVATLGPLPANRVYRVVAVSNPGTIGETVAGIFEASGSTGDTLTGLVAAEGMPDVMLPAGMAIRVRDTAKYFDELQSAVNALESGAVMTTGNQSIDGVKTHFDEIHIDMRQCPTQEYLRIIPEDANCPVTFNYAVASTVSGLDPAHDDGVMNSVVSHGWNISGGGSELVAGYGYCRDGWEWHYSPEGTLKQWERHVAASYFPGSVYGGETRPITIRVQKDTSLATIVHMNAREFDVMSEAGQTQIGTFSRDAAGGVNRFIVWGAGASEGAGFPLYVTSIDSPAQDTLNVGRYASGSTNLNVRSTNGAGINFTTSNGTSNILQSGGIMQFFSLPAGSMLFRTDTLSFVNYASSRFIMRMADDGTKPLIGFLGAAPVARQSGDIGAGLVALGLFSSTTGGGGGLAIGGAVAGGTAGRVLFEAAGPVLADSANFTIDSTGQVMTLGPLTLGLWVAQGSGWSLQGAGCDISAASNSVRMMGGSNNAMITLDLNGFALTRPAAGTTQIKSDLTGQVLINKASAGTAAAQFEVQAKDASTPIFAGYTSVGGAAAMLIRPDGSIKPPALADSAAVNDSIYYSTTASKLVYKNAAGVVNALY